MVDSNTASFNAYENIKNLSVKELHELSESIRGEIISAMNGNGGHLSSNLGIVETTVALYHNFDFSRDKLIFDVGHQCYAHKILSGRESRFASIRTDGGLSGFPDASESSADLFTTGHAGTSIAAGLGLCAARDMNNEDYAVVVVVGDGALVNGLNLEAITAQQKKPKNFIVILNDNGMSISKNRNGLYSVISKGTTNRGYVGGKTLFKKIFKESFVTVFFRKVRGLIKRVLNGRNYFEQFGFKYVGVIDGNDIGQTDAILNRIKLAASEKAVLLHIKTTKGKGYKQAEECSDLYHGVGKNLSVSGSDSASCGRFAETLGQTLVELISENKSVVAITAGMKDGTGLSVVEKTYPENFYDVGIAEEYAVTFAAGLAKGGKLPVVAIYSTFLQRAYDEIIHDVCLQKLPVIFCLDRAGLVGEDGKTHQGVFDLSYLTHIPEMTIFAPSSAKEFGEALRFATKLNKPVAIRYPKCGKTIDCGVFDGKWSVYNAFNNGEATSALFSENGSDFDLTVLAVGGRVAEIASSYAKHSKRKVRVVSARVVKPLDKSVLLAIADKPIITVEENSLIGGFGASVAQFYASNNMCVKLACLGVKDEFIAHGTIENQLKYNGISVEELKNKEEFLFDKAVL